MDRIAVVGAGTMGHGIAQVAAMAGFATTITDALDVPLQTVCARIEKNLAGAVSRGKMTQADADATLGRILVVPQPEVAVANADLVIEAIQEDMTAKCEMFALLDRFAKPGAILATNTSSLSVGRIADATTCPTRVLGLHFFNPVHIMSLVEIVVHARTSQAVLDEARAVVLAIGKHPIVVKDSAGFASSRLGVALGLEAMRMVEEGIATVQDVDTAMELGYGHPMGPLRVTDIVGLDVRLHIAEYLHRELGAAHFRPPDILRQKVARNELGRKTGKGFYEWPKT